MGLNPTEFKHRSVLLSVTRVGGPTLYTSVYNTFGRTPHSSPVSARIMNRRRSYLCTVHPVP